MAEYQQGFFRPQYPEKYQGDPTKIVYRSSWERKAFKWCDLNSNILKWASEEFSIRYFNPATGKHHRYYPDLIVTMKETTGEIKKYVIEIKPYRQTNPPVQSPKKKTKTFINESITYQKNLAKWTAAEAWCKDRGLIFMLVTERELGIK
jgi:hypothetical protein